MKRVLIFAASLFALCSADAGWQSRDSNYNVAIANSGSPVALDSCSTHSSSGTPLADINHTVGPALVGGILTVNVVMGSNVTASIVAAVWDLAGANQLMTAVPGSPAVNGTQQIFSFYLLNPTAGNKILSITWLGGGVMSDVACSYQGASGVANFTSTNGGTPQLLPVTAGSNAKVFGAFSSNSNFTSTGATQIDIDNSQPQWAIAWQRASGPNPTLQGNPGDATSLSAGFAIVP